MSARTLTLTDGTIQHRFSVLGHDRLVCAIAPNGTVAEYDGMDGHEHLVRETTANGCVSHYLHDRLYQINLMGGAVVHLAGGAPHEYVTRIENVSMTPLAQGASDAIDELDELGDHCSDEAAQALTAHLEELRVLADGTGTTHYYGHGAINSRGFCGDQRLPRPVSRRGRRPRAAQAQALGGHGGPAVLQRGTGEWVRRARAGARFEAAQGDARHRWVVQKQG